MLKGDGYINILQEWVLIKLQNKFPQGNEVFHQDMAPKSFQKYFQEQNIKMLQWITNFQI